MRQPSAAALRGLAVDIEVELSRLARLESAIVRAQKEAVRDSELADGCRELCPLVATIGRPA